MPKSAENVSINEKEGKQAFKDILKVLKDDANAIVFC
eukprot:CAMPEP_0116919766 /NCGR_PEP_ID=MMETSP0467-20121206/20594_1 /TAXON_ID=283647 /ORGANISM="Mesodinium pulex, Strain SPMC105" /LENGTH=36 /DNA_ID= /DNA_START= /DNA_END= /DNA_ORIENTATION=